MPDRSIVTRFAPSPTGHLHVGGARTALFSWAFARRHSSGGGKFLLRLEDTDQSRSSEASTRAIIEDLKWLGLTWDEGPDPEADNPYQRSIGAHGPYFQSQRLEIYRGYVKQLVDAGRAFEDGGAVRFRMPQRDITVHDEVLGDVTITRDQLEDFVILKGDGFPTFHLAVVVDDALMGTTHVLRGQEHLMNTPKHVALQEALGFPTPAYAHMPAILNPDGSKMSKRDKAKVARKAASDWLKQQALEIEDVTQLAEAAGVPVGQVNAFLAKETDDIDVAQALATALRTPLPEINVHDFRRSGYLPEVLLNYLTLLGWSPPDKDHERFGLDYLVASFGLDRIGKSNARFDRAKLLAFNADTLAKLPPEVFREKLQAHLGEFHADFLRRLGDRFPLFADSYRPRSRTLGEPTVLGRFFAQDDCDLQHDAKAVEKVLKKNDGAGLAALRELRPLLADLQPWAGEAIHRAIEGFAAQTKRGMGDVAQPLRVAVSGSTVSPAIHDTLVILGKPSTLARIDRCLQISGQ